TSKAADLFLEQPGAEQRKLLRLVLETASWKGEELRMSFRSPFSQLRLSNRATHTNNGQLGANESVSDIWRCGWDSDPSQSHGICNLLIPGCKECKECISRCIALVRIGQADLTKPESIGLVTDARLRGNRPDPQKSSNRIRHRGAS